MKDTYYSFWDSELLIELVRTTAEKIYTALVQSDYKYSRFMLLDFIDSGKLLKLFQEIGGRREYNYVMSSILGCIFEYLIDQGLNVKMDTVNTWNARSIIFPSLLEGTSKSSKWVFAHDYNLYPKE